MDRIRPSVRNPLTAGRKRTHLAAVEGHGEVGVLCLACFGEQGRDRLAHQLHLGHVAAAPNQMDLGHGNTLAGGNAPILMGHGWGQGQLAVLGVQADT